MMSKNTCLEVRLTLPDVERRLRAELEEETRGRLSADRGRIAPKPPLHTLKTVLEQLFFLFV